MTRQNRDRGAALPIALIFGLVVMIIATSVISTGTSGLRAATTNEDQRRAAEYAVAGLEDYRIRLTIPGYWKYANRDAPFSKDNVAFFRHRVGDQNDAFNVATTEPWGGDQVGGEYRYEVDNSAVENEGVLRVRVTGKSGHVSKSLVARFTSARFTDNMLIFDRLRTSIGQHDPGDGAFRDGEIAGANAVGVLSGPVHVNETALMTCGAVFEDPATANTRTYTTYRLWVEDQQTCSKRAGTSTQFLAPSDKDGPRYDATYAFPPSAADALRLARANGAPGCLYTGPTRIVLHANATMTVRSPLSKDTNVGDGAAHTNCGDQAALSSAQGATVGVPDEGIVFIQDVPSDPSDRNATSTAELAPACFTGNGVGFPLTGEIDVRSIATAADSSWQHLIDETAPCTYGTRSGDLFVEGTLNGKVTLGAANIVMQTGNLVYADPALDMLGIVAENAYEIWAPVSAPTAGAALSTPVTRTDAAILVVKGPFRAQHTVFGGSTHPDAVTTLSLTGSVASLFEAPLRSTIPTSSGNQRSGWQLDLRYDWRLQTQPPPLFPRPFEVSFTQRQVVEVPPAFDPNGSPK